MLPQALALACLALTAQAVQQLSFQAVPPLAVEAVSEDIKLDCKIPATVTNVEQAIMVRIRQTTGSNGHDFMTLFGGSGEEDGSNRTQVEGGLTNKNAGATSTFLTVTILEPLESDSGTYECNILYFDSDKDIQNVVSTVSVNVSALPPPKYVAQPSDTCGCEDLRAEIDSIKANLSERGTGAPPPSSECQVSFSAHRDGRNAFSLEDDITIVFNSATANKGGAYDTTSGEFTAPCDGQYYFTVTLRSYQDLDAGYVNAVIMADNTEMARTSVMTEEPISNYQQASTGSVVTLTQGQKVKVVLRTTSSGWIGTGQFSVFSGFYLSP